MKFNVKKKNVLGMIAIPRFPYSMFISVKDKQHYVGLHIKATKSDY